MVEARQKLVGPLAGFMLFFGLSSVYALDASVAASTESPFEFFKTGVSAYKSGHKDEAIRSLRYAAEMGHTGAKWKLARMYADGDGVPEDDFEAYELFLKIVGEGVDPGSQNETYVSDALVALAHYVRWGIPGTTVKADPARARGFYVQAASNFGNSEAQYELGRMLLAGEGGEKNAVQAARWFQLSARKGNSAAQAMLGNMLFQAGKTVRGLAMMTAAYERANPEDREWIQPLQERAFAIAGEADRRTAISLASDITSNSGL